MKHWLSIKPFLLAAIMSVFVTISWAAEERLPFYNSQEFTPHWLAPDDTQLAGFHAIPDFRFTNQWGETVTQDAVQGKLYVASFFFTTCPGICPTLRSRLEKVHAAYKNDDAVLILSHSIRPSTDSVEILKQYADKNGIEGDSWQLLTGDQSATYALAKSAYFASEDLGNIQNTEDFLHTENLLLIDQHRRIRGIYNGLSRSSVNYLISDIAVLKQELQ